MFRSTKVFAFLLLGACSSQHLDQAELGTDTARDTTLAELSTTARELSAAYSTAAKRTKTTQDVLSFLVVTSAVAAVSGAVTDAPKEDIAAAAIAGTAAQQGAARMAPKAAIDSIYDGAKRMNCISAVAELGRLKLVADVDEQAAVIVTRWAIEHVRILTREKLTQDSATFTGMLGEYKTSLDQATGLIQAERQGLKAMASIDARETPGPDFTAYLELLDKCTNTELAPLTDKKS